MVQFGRYLHTFQYEPWKDHYINYQHLKKLLYNLKEYSDNFETTGHRDIESCKPFLLFQDSILQNLESIESFFISKRSELEETFTTFERKTSDGNCTPEHKLMVEKLYVQSVLLKDFSSLNYTGFVKILKKCDKLMKGRIRPLKYHFIQNHLNPKVVFGIHERLYKLQMNSQYLYSDRFCDGNRLKGEIALGASMIETIGETKRERLVPRTANFMMVEVADGILMSSDNDTNESSMLWMRARVALMSVGKDSSIFPILIALAFIVIGGCGQTVILEYMVKNDPDCGPTILFFQFLSISFFGAPQFVKLFKSWHSPVSFNKRNIPMSYHLMLVVISWLAAYSSSVVYNFGVSVSVHMVFKSGILLVNMLLGVLILGKRYSFQQIASVCLVTSGILLTTFSQSPDTVNGSESSGHVIGLFILFLSLVLTGLLGIVQDMAYAKFGNHWSEVLFYVHFLGLPFNIVIGEQIWNDAYRWSIESPEMWIALFANAFLSFIGVRGIYNLCGLTTSLSTSLSITVRKFMSLLVSAIYFGNNFQTSQWLGALIVLFGSIWYTLSSSERVPESREHTKKE